MPALRTGGMSMMFDASLPHCNVNAHERANGTHQSNPWVLQLWSPFCCPTLHEPDLTFCLWITEGRPPKRAPLQFYSRAGLVLFLRARLGSVVPRAASFVATGFIGCLCHISGEGRAGEGKCQCQHKHRNDRFHGHYSLGCSGCRKNSGLPQGFLG
jgi:hypothetical protein